MFTKKSKEYAYSQNFIFNKHLLEKLITYSGISSGDLVIDIGAGLGSITDILINRRCKVIAVEIDPNLYCKLAKRHTNSKYFIGFNKDFLDIDLPNNKYKIFSNIPFNYSSRIIKKLYFDSNISFPDTSYLVVQDEFYKKYSGIGRETMNSILLKPFFKVVKKFEFRRSDFIPKPSVKVVLMAIFKRHKTLVPVSQRSEFNDFICFIYNLWRPNTKSVLREIFTDNQINKLSSDLKIDPNLCINTLTFNQILGIYNFYSKRLPGITLIEPGYYKKYREKEIYLSKVYRTR